MISGLPLQLFAALGSVAVLLGLMALIRRGAARLDWTPEVQRKLVHVGTGIYAMTFPWIFADRWPVFLLVGTAIGVMLVLRLPQLSRQGIGATLHSVERHSYGDLLLALGIGTVFLHSNGSLILYILPLTVLTFSDAAAALTGSNYGRRFFTVEEGVKSLEGSAVFFITAFALSMICLLALSDTPRINVIFLSAIFAGFATLIEADSWRGFDNFFLPAGLMIFLQAYIHTPPTQLFGLMVVFATLLSAALLLAPALNFTRHSARVYVTASCLILSVVGPIFGALPVLVFIAYVFANRMTPTRQQHWELDIIVAVALMSFFWLLAGQESGTFNIELYNLASLTMIVALVTLAFRNQGWIKALVAGLVTAILGAVVFQSIYAPIAHANNMDVDLPTLGTCLAIGIFLPLIRSDWFDRARVITVSVSAMAIPLASFLFQYSRILAN